MARWLVVIVFVLTAGKPACLAADQLPASQPAAQGDEPFTPSPEFQQWITAIVRQQLPDDYEKRKNWGHTAKAFDGVSVWIEDGHLETRRKYKDANDVRD